MTFRALAIATAALCLGLAAVWSTAPEIPLSIWGIAVHDTELARILGQRSAALFAAFALLLWTVRDMPVSPSRVATSTALATGCVLLAASGLFNMITGRASAGMLTATIAELALAAGLLALRSAPR